MIHDEYGYIIFDPLYFFLQGSIAQQSKAPIHVLVTDSGANRLLLAHTVHLSASDFPFHATLSRSSCPEALLQGDNAVTY